MFPVFGANAKFSDDYGAPRAGTGWHHGNDIFAVHQAAVRAVERARAEARIRQLDHGMLRPVGDDGACATG